MTQIYGYTPPETAPVDGFVKYLMAFVLPNGNVLIRVRNHAGVDNDIEIPRTEQAHLSGVLAPQ